MDHRSFTLNFEVNAFIYDQQIAKKLKQAFIDDLAVSSELTKARYAKRSLWIKFKEVFHNYCHLSYKIEI